MPSCRYRNHASLAHPRFDFLRALPQGLSLTHIELLYAYHWAADTRRAWKHCSFYLRHPKALLHDERCPALRLLS